MSGFLATLKPVPGAQIEAIYVAYYGRAADGGGYLYWQNDAATLIAGGLTATQAAVNIADSFALQPESQNNYSFLAAPPATLNPADPVQIASVDTFIEQVYANLFNRVVTGTDAGVQYWQQQILTGAVSVGSAVYDIANGATGADATVLGFKVEAGLYFTTQTQAANIGSTAASVAGNPVFIPTATDVITPVVDQATETTSQGWTDAFVASGGTVNTTIPIAPVTKYTLTAAQDTFTTSTAGVLFNAPLATSSTEISGGSNVNLQTLTVGDSLVDTVGDGTLQAWFNQSTNGDHGSATGTDLLVPSVTFTGIATATLTVAASGTFPIATQGFFGNVTGLTTVNDQNSLAGIQLGQTGQGLNTALANVNVTGYSAPAGNLIFDGVIAMSAGSAANTIKVALGGTLGGTGLGKADVLSFSADTWSTSNGGSGALGTAANPNLSYGTWALTVNSSANLQLEQGGVGAATALVLAGAGNVAVGQDSVGFWQKLTTIDASTSTGNVTITGYATDPGVYPAPGHFGQASNVGNLFISGGAGTGFGGVNPYGLFGAAVGLLDGNTALTQFKLGTGVDQLDVSSFTTAAQLGALTTVANTASTSTDNEIIVLGSVAVAGTVGSSFGHIAGFEVLGLVDAVTGTINYANLPGTIDEILYQTLATAGAAVKITNAPAANYANAAGNFVALTVDTEQNGNGSSLTVSTPAGVEGGLAIDIGNTTTFATPAAVAAGIVGAEGWLGTVTLTGETFVTFNSVGDGTAFNPATQTASLANGANLIGVATGVFATPATTADNEKIWVAGSQSVVFGNIFDLSAGLAAAVNENNLTLTISDSAPVEIGTAATTPGLALLGQIYAPFVNLSSVGVDFHYSTNAAVLNASASGGLFMQGGDANYTISVLAALDQGDTITGSATGANVLIGSIGNDKITGTLSTSAVDTIATGGGKDGIALAANHAAVDHIELYMGTGNGPAALHPYNLSGGDVVLTAFAGSAVSNNLGASIGDVAQPGWWGINVNGWNGTAGGPGYNVSPDNLVFDLVSAYGQPTGTTGTVFGGAWGTSADVTTVTNFAATDVVDVSLSAFGAGGGHTWLQQLNKLTTNAGIIPPVNAGGVAGFVAGVFTTATSPGDTISFGASGNANVLLLGNTYSSAASVAQGISDTANTVAYPANPAGVLKFNVPFTLFDTNTTSHLGKVGSTGFGGEVYAADLLVAYWNGTGVSLATLDISVALQTGAHPAKVTVANTQAGDVLVTYAGATHHAVEHIGVSDLVTLTGVTLPQFAAGEVHFVV